ncbi:MAG: WD40/YVTN/BNR-like repeat-containing protein [Actinomycetota bacterium]
MTHEVVVATTEGLFYPPAPGPVELRGREVNALAHAPGAGRWALVDGGQLWSRSGEWSHLATAEGVRLNCLLPLGKGLLVGASGAHLFRLTGEGLQLVDGFERAEGRDEWFTPWGGPPDVRSLSGSGPILANVHVGGILRSGDGESWSQTIDITCDVHEVIAQPDGLVLAATARGLGISRNGGESWSFEQAGLHATYCRAVAVCENYVLLSASLGPRGGRAAVYRRAVTEHGPFEKCNSGLPEWFGDNIDTGCLASSGRRAAFATGDGRVFLSEDCGGEWKELAGGLPPIRQVSLIA